MRGLLLVLVFAAPSAAERFCGSVTIAGRPLPEGAVSLFKSTGPATVSMVPLSGGRFCGDAPAGRYRVEVAPLGLWQPMTLRAKGGGEALVVVGSGADAELESAPTLPSPEWSTLEGTLLFPPGSTPRDGHALVHVQVQTPAFSSAFVWVDVNGDESAFRLRVPTGRASSVQVRLPGWGVKSMDPPYSMQDRLSLVFKPAQTLPMRLTMASSGRIEGKVTLPDASAFKPVAGEDADRRLAGFWAKSMDGDFQYLAFAGADGSARMEGMAAGLYHVEPAWRGSGFEWARSPSRLVRVEAGRTARFDVALKTPGRVRVAAEGLPAALDSATVSFYNPKSRWVIGLPEGRPGPADTSVLVFEEEAAFSLFQSSEGVWMPTGVLGRSREELSLARVPAGKYSVWLVESQDLLDFPSVRVLSSGAISVGEGERASVTFRPADARAAGDAELRGTVRAPARWTLAALRGAATMTELHAMLAPRINLYDTAGRLAGTAFAAIPGNDLKRLVRALETDDEPTLRTLLDGVSRPFRLKGLAPGRYRAEAVAFGWPTFANEVELSAAKPAVLDATWGKP